MKNVMRKNRITIKMLFYGSENSLNDFFKENCICRTISKFDKATLCNCISLSDSYVISNLGEAINHAINPIWLIRDQFLLLLGKYNIRFKIYITSYDFDSSTELYIENEVLYKILLFHVDLFFSFNKFDIEQEKLQKDFSLKKERTKIIIDLGIHSDKKSFSPDDCTLQTGIIPDNVRRCGEPNSAGKIMPFAEWGIQEKKQSRSFNSIINDIMLRIEKKQNNLAAYTSKNQCDLMLNITIELGDDAPQFFILSAQNISKIAGLKCDIGFDFYDYRKR